MWTIGCAVRPRTRNQLDRIEADADQQIGLVDDRPLERAVGEHAGEMRIVVGHDALRLVGHHRRQAAARAQRRDRFGVERPARAEADEQQRLPRARQQRRERRRIEKRELLGRSVGAGRLLQIARPQRRAPSLLDRARRGRQHVARTSMCTGPRGSVIARSIASRITASAFSGDSVADHFVTGASSARWSTR